ncbi:MAG TPA: M23 family metallopeptidase [Vitreimonas sp.]|nr:M23 family metallopeptidase [Vitreimonas sp.]
MPRIQFEIKTPAVVSDFGQFGVFVRRYIRTRGYRWFSRFEILKDALVDLLYKQRGKYTRPFLHFGTIGLVFFVITFGPFILRQAEENTQAEIKGGVLTANAYGENFQTVQAEQVRQYRGGEIVTHVVQEGETLSSIAERYGLDISTIQWENNLDKNPKLKPGQELRILPVNGVRHKVQRGETIQSIGKKYGLEDEAELQSIVDYPFNEFSNDETFELATGQFLVVPEGVKPDDPVARPVSRVATRFTPDAGSVAATGSFVWPAAGRITQGYQFYHKAFDIANKGGGPILAADSGTVVVAGWIDNSGYGNRVMVDHGNGYVTLYAHMSVVQVQSGQRVNRGDLLGQMGSTGRSTGTHLHFEVRQGGNLLNPGNFLR